MSKISIFISYAWDEESRIKRKVNHLKETLECYDVIVHLDTSDNSKIGDNIDNYIDHIKTVDYIIIFLSESYFDKIKNSKSRVYQEWHLILDRLKNSECVLPVLCEHLEEDIYPESIRGLVRYNIDDYIDKKIVEKIFEKSPTLLEEKSILSFSNPLDRESLISASKAIAKDLFSEYDWHQFDFNNLIDKRRNEIRLDYLDVHQDNLVAPSLDIETIYLEGFFNDELKTVLVFTNAYISEKVKYLSNVYYKKHSKTIHFYDRHFLESYFDNNVDYFSDETSDDKHEQLNFRVYNAFFVTRSEYHDLKSAFIDLTNKVGSGKIPESMQMRPVRNLINNTIYYLQLELFSSKDQKVRIKFNNDTPLHIISEDDYELDLKLGHIMTYIPIYTKTAGKYREIELVLYNAESKIFKLKMGSFEIVERFEPKFVFTKQREILEAVYKLIKNNMVSESNIFVSVFADAGAGKTYLLQELTSDISNHFQSTADTIYINFTNDMQANSVMIANLLFYIFMELPFNCSRDWLESEIGKQQSLPPNLIKLIKELKGYPSFKDIGILIEEINSCGGLTMTSRTHSIKKRILIIDDLHKLKGEMATLFIFVLKQIIKYYNKFVIVCATREKELDKEIKTWLSTYKIYRLSYLTSENIKDSLKLSNNSMDKYVDDSIIDITFEGFLIYYAIDFIKRMCLTTHRSLFEFNENVKAIRTDIISPNYIQKRIDDLSAELRNTLNIIFSLHSIDVHLFTNGDYENLMAKTTLSALIMENFIINKAGFYFPAHDLLFESFKIIYNENLALFCIELLASEVENANHNKLLSIIIKCEFSDRLSYVNKTYKTLLRLYEETRFGETLQLVQSLLCSFNDSDVSSNFKEYDRLNINHIYATCLNHCGSLTKSKYIFSENASKKSLDNPKYMGLVFEAITEKCNIDYWQLDTYNLIKELKATRDRIKAFDVPSDVHLVNAYLNTLNREMVTNLLLDNYQSAEELFRICLEESRNLNRKDYEGFAYMDYAKGIYNIDPIRAIKFLKEAHSIFEETHQERRSLDCQCEIAYLKTIVHKHSIDTLIEASNNLRNKGLIQLYVKSIIKILAIRLTTNEFAIGRINDVLGQVTLYSPDSVDERLKLILSNIDLIKSIKTSSDSYFSDLNYFMKNCLIGNSYLSIYEHNQNQKKESPINWAFDRHEPLTNTFLLDLRIW